MEEELKITLKWLGYFIERFLHTLILKKSSGTS